MFLLLLLCARIAGAQEVKDSPPASDGLLIAVAANAAPALQEIARAFTGETSIPVTFSTGSSGALSRQAREGAPFDLLVLADMARVEQLAEQGVVNPKSVVAYARGVLVLWQPSAARPHIRSLDDLSSPAASRMRLALANPAHAPYGMAARTALEKLGLWTKLKDRVIYGEDVGQVHQIARTGNVDAAFLPQSLVQGRPDGTWFEVPERLHPPILQGMGVMSGTRQTSSAQRFQTFLLSERGQEILGRHGYQKP